MKMNELSMQMLSCKCVVMAVGLVRVGWLWWFKRNPLPSQHNKGKEQFILIGRAKVPTFNVTTSSSTQSTNFQNEHRKWARRMSG